MIEQSFESDRQGPSSNDFELRSLTVVARERLIREGLLAPEVIAAAEILPEPASIPIRILRLN